MLDAGESEDRMRKNLCERAREHVDRDNPQMQLSDEQVRGIVAEGAYDK
jgi:hypothetical protein